MIPVLYDSSFDGFLSAIFEVYNHKIRDASISIAGTTSGSLFANGITVNTNTVHSKRVWSALEQKLSLRARSDLYKAFLSEIKGVENLLLRYVQNVFTSKGFVEHNYTNADVLLVRQTASKVQHEKRNREAYVRFQQMKDDLYFASIQPEYNVLPLLCKYFQDRYADQRWLIYDAMRRYGIYYDLETVNEVQFSFSEVADKGNNIATAYDLSEAMYQLLWKQYFSSVNIPGGKNMKLHIQHMPKRYWKNLTEKQ
jgi:probable DNA metabolism protein